MLSISATVIYYLERGGDLKRTQLVRHWAGDPGDRDMNHVTAITFNCAAIHFTAVHNVQHHQTPVPLIPCLHGVGS